jgi:hypothetical protein
VTKPSKTSRKLGNTLKLRKSSEPRIQKSAHANTGRLSTCVFERRLTFGKLTSSVRCVRKYLVTTQNLCRILNSSIIETM